jgi:hypothetical protein
MSRLALCIHALVLSLCTGAACAAPPEITLSPDKQNPGSPQMGDRLIFHSAISNTGKTPAEGVVAWISLVQIDPGHEQPMDLEDWSAQKAVTQAVIPPGQQLLVDWPLRLIQAGTYRIVVSAVERNTPQVITSPFEDFQVRRKPVVKPGRILPVAVGVPLLLLGVMVVRRRSDQP